MLEELERALKNTGIPFAHFWWEKAPAGEYGVWAEDSAQHFYSDNKVDAQTTQGTVDLFTKTDDGKSKEKIQEAMNGVNCSWYLSSVQFETDTGYIHYEWIFEVC